MTLRVVALALAMLCSTAVGFIRPSPRALRPVLASPSRSFSLASTLTPRDELVAPDLVGGSADFLRSAALTNSDGQPVQLGDMMGTGKSVVVFLRHLGW